MQASERAASHVVGTTNRNLSVVTDAMGIHPRYTFGVLRVGHCAAHRLAWCRPIQYAML